jgi:hypothetical protein
MDEHISRFGPDADNPSQLPNHGVWPGLRLLLQSFLTSFLDLPDLANHKAQPPSAGSKTPPEASAAGSTRSPYSD